MNHAIRKVQEKDIDACVNVIRASFQTVADEFGFTEENAPRYTAFATDAQRIRWQLLEEQRPMYAYFEGDAIVGYYSLAMQDENACELNNLCVLPDYRHKGIGEALLSDAFSRAGSLGFVRMNAGIVEENQLLRKWYEDFGFIHLGCKKYDFFPFTCGYMTKEFLLSKKIQQLFAQIPDVKYGYTDISYSSFGEEYKSALVIAVPHEKQLVLKEYTEEAFDASILNTKARLEQILKDIEDVLKEKRIKYYIPPVAQQNEEDLLAVFSFKYAAVNAGLGWIGKNDVLITEEYGPRVRLSAVLIDHPFEPGERITESRCGTCSKCVDTCPHKALRGVNWDINTQRSEIIDYHLCNQKRSAYIETHGRKHACGLCMVVCPFGANK